MHDPKTLHLRLVNILGPCPSIPEGADLNMVSKVLDTLETLAVKANHAERMGLHEIATAIDQHALTGIAHLVTYFASLDGGGQVEPSTLN